MAKVIKHFIPFSTKRSSGLEVKNTMVQLQEQKQLLGYKSGPVISDINGDLLYLSDMDKMLRTIFYDLFERNPNFSPPHIRSKLGIIERYHSN